MPPNIRYASYLLRLQWTQNGEHPTWISCMQSTKTGEQHWFPNLEALVQFLCNEFDGCDRKDSSLPGIEEGPPYAQSAAP